MRIDTPRRRDVKIATVALAYHEERFIGPHIRHIPSWVDKKVVLVSTLPWQGEPEFGSVDRTRELAKAADPHADVYEFEWTSEEEQRNSGQDILCEYDWIIVLDPDEFLSVDEWAKLKEFLNNDDSRQCDAYVSGLQFTYWKRHLRIDPNEDYRQIIAVRPTVRFVDKRVVNCPWAYSPITLHHMSWARTDAEVWRKITHYSHAHEFDAKRWYEEVWLANKQTDLHPLTPSSLRRTIPASLPPDLEALGLWPK